jgi:hypothetical protein
VVMPRRLRSSAAAVADRCLVEAMAGRMASARVAELELLVRHRVASDDVALLKCRRRSAFWRLEMWSLCRSR